MTELKPMSGKAFLDLAHAKAREWNHGRDPEAGIRYSFVVNMLMYGNPHKPGKGVIILDREQLENEIVSLKVLPVGTITAGRVRMLEDILTAGFVSDSFTCKKCGKQVSPESYEHDGVPDLFRDLKKLGLCEVCV